MQQYHDQLRLILDQGTPSSDRTGTGTTSYFGMQARYPLSDGFPLVTTKKLHLRSIIHELLWFLSGDTNIKYLKDNGVSIWDEWADENGDLGPVYGYQWRNFPALQNDDGILSRGSVDQVEELIKLIKTSPDSRRMIVSAWNPLMCPTWRCRPVIRFGKCGSLAASCICSSINAPPICSLVCRSTSPRMLCCW